MKKKRIALKKKIVPIGVAALIVLIAAAVYLQFSKPEFIPGTACKVDSECKLITYTIPGFLSSTNSLCAHPKDFTAYWTDQHPDISISIDESVGCFCGLKNRTSDAPIYACARKKA